MTVVALRNVPSVPHHGAPQGRAEVAVTELAACPLTAALSPSERHELAAALEVEQLGPGYAVVRQGAPGFALVVVGAGVAVATRAGRPVRRLGRGDWVARLDGAPAGESLTAETALTAYVLDAGGVRELARSSPQVAARLAARVALSAARAAQSSDGMSTQSAT